MFRRDRYRRSVLDPLGRQGSDVLIRSDDDLRRAMGEAVSAATPVRFVMAEPFALKSVIEVPSSLNGCTFAGAGQVTIDATGLAQVFDLQNGSQNVVIDGMHVDGSPTLFVGADGGADSFEIVGCRVDSLSFFKTTGTGSNNPAYIRDNIILRTGVSTEWAIDGVMTKAHIGSNFFYGVGSGNAIRLTTGGANVIIGNTIRETDAIVISTSSSYNVIVGNSCGGGTITTTASGGYNTIIGNANVATITALGTDVYLAATDSDPLNT